MGINAKTADIILAHARLGFPQRVCLSADTATTWPGELMPEIKHSPPVWAYDGILDAALERGTRVPNA